MTTASIALGSMPACFMDVNSLPVVGPASFAVPAPVSKSTSLSPVFRMRTFCSSTAFSTGRKLSVSCRLMSSLVRPLKAPLGSPSGSVPSETIVASASPNLKR
jgi:hypothetical protein